MAHSTNLDRAWIIGAKKDPMDSATEARMSLTEGMKPWTADEKLPKPPCSSCRTLTKFPAAVVVKASMLAGDGSTRKSLPSSLPSAMPASTKVLTRALARSKMSMIPSRSGASEVMTLVMSAMPGSLSSWARSTMTTPTACRTVDILIRGGGGGGRGLWGGREGRCLGAPFGWRGPCRGTGPSRSTKTVSLLSASASSLEAPTVLIAVEDTKRAASAPELGAAGVTGGVDVVVLAVPVSAAITVSANFALPAVCWKICSI